MEIKWTYGFKRVFLLMDPLLIVRYQWVFRKLKNIIGILCNVHNARLTKLKSPYLTLLLHLCCSWNNPIELNPIKVPHKLVILDFRFTSMLLFTAIHAFIILKFCEYEYFKQDHVVKFNCWIKAHPDWRIF